MKYLFLIFIYIYQWTVRPFVGGCCRFYPSCSDYSLRAIKKYGACKGGWLSLKRITKCHPYHPGGHDPVP